METYTKVIFQNRPNNVTLSTPKSCYRSSTINHTISMTFTMSMKTNYLYYIKSYPWSILSYPWSIVILCTQSWKCACVGCGYDGYDAMTATVYVIIITTKLCKSQFCGSLLKYTYGVILYIFCSGVYGIAVIVVCMEFVLR